MAEAYSTCPPEELGLIPTIVTTLSWPPRAPSNKCVHVYMQAKYPQIIKLNRDITVLHGAQCHPNTQM